MTKKAKEFKTQSYDVGNDVTVTVTYPSGKRPKMLHNDTQVIVGESPEFDMREYESIAAHERRVANAVKATPTAEPRTNGTLDPSLEARFQQIQSEGRQRRSAAQISADAAAAQGADVSAADMKNLQKELETAALMAIPS